MINPSNRLDSPYIVTKITTTKVMLFVVAAMLPISVASYLVFGIKAILIQLITIASCVLFEALFNIILKKQQTISDLSAVITGMLLSFTYPVTIPVPMAIAGAFAAIVLGKMLFGGLGHNFANPALVGRIFLMLSFSEALTHWVDPGKYKNLGVLSASATPLMSKNASYIDLFLGNVGGSIGETSALAILIGGIFLIITGIIKPYTPIAYILTIGIFAFSINKNPIEQILMGGVMLGAFFMATDYSTTPYTTWGKIFFGIGCGLINMLIRQFGSFPEGTAFSILIMNLATPWLERWTWPEQFGSNTPYKGRKISKIIVLSLLALIFLVLSVVNRL